MLFSHILLTSDLSDEALRAFAPVAELARQSGAKLTLLHVAQEIPAVPYGAPLAPPLVQPDMEELREAARQQLAAQARMLGDELEVEAHVAVGRDLGATVARCAEELGADLIALSTHGRSGFRRLVLGSIAEEILRHASTPVLCFPRAAEN